MKLKKFFLSLAVHNQNVEIYFNENERDPSVGFKINAIDFEVLQELDWNLYSLFESSINEAFINSTLIDAGEGSTSYFLQPDLSCVKTAQIFSSLHETDQYWIDQNETEYCFENIELPFDTIFISKDLDSFKVFEESELKDILSNQQYNEFESFYKELLSDFQEIEIELEIYYDEDFGSNCDISSVGGSYSTKMEFTLLDDSNVDISDEIVEEMLIKYFKIDPVLVSKIVV